MKKHILLLAVILLINVLLPSCRTPGDDASQTDAVTSEPDHYAIDAFTEDGEVKLPDGTLDIALYGSYVYAVLEHSVVKLPINGGQIQPEVLYETEHELDGIAVSDEEKLYCIDQTECVLMAFSLDGNQLAAVSDESGSFWLMELDQGGNSDLIEVDKKGLRGIRRMEFIDENTLVLQDSFSGEIWNLYTYDRNTDKLEQQQQCNDQYCMDYNQGQVFLSDGNKTLHAASEDTNAVLLIHRLNTEEVFRNYIPRKLYVTESNVFYWSVNGHRLVSERLTQNADGKTIVVFGGAGMDGDEKLLAAIRKYERDSGNRVKIAMYTGAQDYQEKMNLKLLAGDTDFDIFLNNASFVSFSSVVKMDAYEPLNNYPALMECFDEMIDGVKDVVSYNGKVIGVPLGFLFEFYYLDADAGEYLDSPPAMTWTMEDLWAACEELLAKQSDRPLFNSNIQLYNLFRQAVFGYCMNEFDFYHATHTTDARENLQELVEKLEYYQQKGVLIGKNGLIHMVNSGTIRDFVCPDDAKVMLFPRYNAEAKNPLITSSILMINPASPHKREAAELLAVYLSEDLRYQNSLTPLFPGMERYTMVNGQPMIHETPQRKALFEKLDEIYRISAIRVGFVPIAEEFHRYESAEIDGEALANLLYEKMVYQYCE